MSDRTDERVTTIGLALNGLPTSQELKTAHEALASLAADAAETQKLREQVDEAQRLMQMWKDEAAAIIATASCFESERNEARAERDAAVADRDRLEKVLRVARLIIADTVQPATYEREDVLSRIDAALAGREGSDDA